ncbi:MAG: hypothetical protein IJB86_05815 [Clostridia bacterium]|nr:hypothetical protein [Clostridia bacterium]
MIPSFININSDFSDYDCGNGVLMRLFDNVDTDSFQLACNQAESNGFALYDSRDIEENFHRSYRKDSLLIYIYYCTAEKKLRVISDSFSDTYAVEKQSFEVRTKSRLWQFENDHTFIDCGMCFILQCADNSFFILDSGHYLQFNDHKRIYRFLKERTPANEKTVIAGWFFSHAHDDHICQFISFLNEKRDDVIIEKLYFNTVPTDHRDSHNWNEWNKKYMRDFENAALSSGLPIVKVHTGQKIFIRNIEVDVLCTHEDTFPQSLKDYNNSSAVYMLTVDGCRIFLPGDASDVESDIMTERYTEKTLSCDILQQAHHGHHGTSVEFYKMCNADVVLFPTTQIKYDEEYEKIEANRVSVDIAKECYIASNGTVELSLPYTPGTAKLLPDETFENFDRIKELWGYDYTEERKQDLFISFLKRSGLPNREDINP